MNLNHRPLDPPALLSDVQNEVHRGELKGQRQFVTCIHDGLGQCHGVWLGAMGRAGPEP